MKESIHTIPTNINFKLNNKIILITGATDGIGKALAKKTAKLGAKIMTIKISYSNKIIKSSTANTVLFSKDKFSLSGLKSYLSNNEFTYINDLLKNSDLKKNLLVFEVS